MVTITSIKLFDISHISPGWVSVDVSTEGAGCVGISIDGGDTVETKCVEDIDIGFGTQFGFGTDYQTIRICAYPIDYPLGAKCDSITIGTPTTTITDFIVGSDNYPATQTRNFVVKGSGGGTYQVKEGSTVITTRTLPASGFDTFDLTNIPEGTHTYCVQTLCQTFTIVTNPVFNKWSCSDNCSVADTTGDYNSKAECVLACTPPSESLSLTVDKAVVTVGDIVNFKASWDRADGTVINLYQALPLGSDFLVGTGSLVNGYVTIPHIFALAGTVVYYACSPGLLACSNESNRITVTIADKTTTYIIYAAGALALAYVAGQWLSNRNKGKVK